MKAWCNLHWANLINFLLTEEEVETMVKKIKWGVIGSGGIARRRTIPEGIVPGDNAELVAVYDINTKANAEVAKKFNATAVGSIDELL